MCIKTWFLELIAVLDFTIWDFYSASLMLSAVFLCIHVNVTDNSTNILTYFFHIYIQHESSVSNYILSIILFALPLVKLAFFHD